jgi:mono/diheme cytochrome c family protein
MTPKSNFKIPAAGVWFGALACAGFLAGLGLSNAQGADKVDVSKLPPPAARPVDFTKDIRPIFAKSCWKCHGPQMQKSGLRLDRSAPALRGGDDYGPDIKPGKSADSPLIHLVSGLMKDLRMPKEGDPLTSEQIGLLRAWIDQGAVWPTNDEADADLPWAFKPVVRPPVPASPFPIRNEIDNFVFAKLASKNISPSPEADRRTLIRRLYFDLLGLPPSPEAVRAFQNDTRRDAYEKLVDQLLASPHYGERWARHWLDVVRFAETHGFEMNNPRPNAWPYRDYVIRAFNDDKPYNQFVMEQLAGDALGADAATGFIVAGSWDQVKSPDVVLTRNQRANELHDMVSTTGSAFLGLTVGCARCHSHKFDPIPQTDYYAMVACFAGVQHGERKITPPDAEAREKEKARREARLAEIDAALAQFEPQAFAGKLLLLDDESAFPAPGGARVLEWVKRTAKGDYAAGRGRGERDDPGGLDRSANFTPSYLAWNQVAGRDVFAYEPKVEGRFRIRLSWGCGWNTHARDAVYVLDRDGDPATRNDQTEIARVDQQKFADGSGDVPNRPLWSGFYDAGIWDLKPASKIVLRGGSTDAYVTADVIALQEAKETGVEKGPANFLRAAVHPRINVDRFAPVTARRIRFTISRTTGAEPCLDELEVYTAGDSPRNVALASAGTKPSASGVYPNSEFHKIEHINDGRHGNSRSWISNESGRGWVELEFPKPVTISRVVWGRDREQKYTDRLALDYRIETATGTDDWNVVASSADRQPYLAGRDSAPSRNFTGLAAADRARAEKLLAERAEHEARLRELENAPMIYAGRFTKPEPTHRLNRGDPMQPRELVAPGPISTLPVKFSLAPEDRAKSGDQERRLALAKWIADPANPLTPRVMVNRIWQHHFGEGLVSTPSDFGANGAKPTHPALLDWLASEFMARGWSIKAIHRLILNSATYRQSSTARSECLAVDAGSRLLWRFPSFRLEAEPIRDTILTVSGQIDLKMGGPGFSFFKPNNNYVRVYDPKKEFGPADWRRMVYGTVVRQRPDGVFGVFDCPDGGQIAPKRTRSTTPLQALNMLNSSFLMQQAGLFAQRLQQETGSDENAQVRRAFELAFDRNPAPDELDAAVQLTRKEGLRVFCRALFNANEFIYVF